MPAYHDLKTRRVWCQSPKPEYELDSQRYGMPARCIPLMRPELDIIVLPGAHPPTLEAWFFYKAVLGLSDDQVIWTPGTKFNMDDNMDADTVDTLARRMEMLSTAQPDFGLEWLLIPYCPTTNFLRWANELIAHPLFSGLQEPITVTFFGESTEWLAKFGDKGMLHRKMSDLDAPSMIETIDPTIPVPRGYVCETTEELLKARELMSDLPDVCIKPLSGATGVGIKLKPSLEDLQKYDFPMGPVNLEEYLRLDFDDRGEAVSPVLHYMAEKFCGSYMLDQIMEGCSYSGWQRTCVSREFQAEAERAMTKFLEYALPTGAGGVDFLSVDGKPLLTDINTGRFNGAHPSKLFHEAHAPEGSEFYVWKLKPDEMAKMTGVGMPDIWERLCEAGLAFKPSVTSFATGTLEDVSGQHGEAIRSGIFPLVGLRGLRYQFLAIGQDKAETMALVYQAKEVLKQVSPPSIHESPVLTALTEASGPKDIQPLMLGLAEEVVSSMPEEFETDPSMKAWNLNKLITTKVETLEVELPEGGEHALTASALEGVLHMATTEDAVTTDMPAAEPVAQMLSRQNSAASEAEESAPEPATD